MPDYASAPESAKLLKQALKQAFPATRFSVRLSRGTGYGDCHVSWTDGPTEKLVESEVIRRFEGHGFDGMTDIRYHKDARLADGRQSGLRLISCQHAYSDQHISQLIRAIGTRYHVPREEWPSLEDYKAGRTWNTSPFANEEGCRNRNSWQDLIHRVARDRTELER